MSPRANKLKRLGAELYRLKRLSGGQDVPYSHNVAHRMQEIRADIHRLTREMLDRAEGVPPALVEDLMQREYHGAATGQWERSDAFREWMARGEPEEHHSEKMYRLEESVKNALVKAGPPPEWAKDLIYKPR